MALNWLRRTVLPVALGGIPAATNAPAQAATAATSAPVPAATAANNAPAQAATAANNAPVPAATAANNAPAQAATAATSAPVPAAPAPAAPAPRGRVAEMAARFQARNNEARAAANAARVTTASRINTAAWNRNAKKHVQALIDASRTRNSETAKYYRALGLNQTGRGRRTKRARQTKRRTNRKK